MVVGMEGMIGSPLRAILVKGVAFGSIVKNLIAVLIVWVSMFSGRRGSSAMRVWPAASRIEITVFMMRCIAGWRGKFLSSIMYPNLKFLLLLLAGFKVHGRGSTLSSSVQQS